MPWTATQTESTDQTTLLIDADEVARQLGVCERCVWRFASTGKMPRPVRIGRSSRWRAEEVRAWVEAGCPNRQMRDMAEGRNNERPDHAPHGRPLASPELLARSGPPPLIANMS